MSGSTHPEANFACSACQSSGPKLQQAHQQTLLPAGKFQQLQLEKDQASQEMKKAGAVSRRLGKSREESLAAHEGQTSEHLLERERQVMDCLARISGDANA